MHIREKKYSEKASIDLYIDHLKTERPIKQFTKMRDFEYLCRTFLVMPQTKFDIEIKQKVKNSYKLPKGANETKLLDRVVIS